MAMHTIRLTVIFMIMSTLSCLSIGEARIYDVEAQGIYEMEAFETPAVAEKRAEVIALRQATEQAGTSVLSHSVVQNGSISKDEVEILALHVLKIKNKSFSYKKNGSKTIIVCHVMASVDDGNLNKELLLEVRKNKKKIIDINNKLEQLARENETFKKLYMVANTPSATTDLLNRIRRNEEQFSYDSWMSNGNNLLAYGDYVSAVESFRKASEIDPQKAGPYLYMADAYISMQKYSLAKELLEKASARDSLSPGYFILSGRINIWENKYQEAIENYTKAIQLGEESAYAPRAAMYALLGDDNSAIKDYTSAINKFYIDKNTFYFRGLSYARIGRYDEALIDFSKAIDISHNAKTYIARAEVYRKQRRYDKAIADLKYAQGLSPKEAHANIALLLGTMYYCVGDFSNAIRECTVSASNHYMLAENYGMIGVSYYQLHEYRKAVYYLDLALKENSHLSDLKKIRTDIKITKGI